MAVSAYNANIRTILDADDERKRKKKPKLTNRAKPLLLPKYENGLTQ